MRGAGGGEGGGLRLARAREGRAAGGAGTRAGAARLATARRRSGRASGDVTGAGGRWVEATHYLHRPTGELGGFIEAQKARMGWRRPVIGIHMRLGVDKNREAQAPTAKKI